MSQKNDPAIWSRTFARDVASGLGITGDDWSDPRIESLASELTEAFRFLPIAQVNATDRYARFLRANLPEGQRSNPLIDWAVEALGEVCDLARFLRTRHGYSRPADESDEWSDEDARDFSQAAWKRLDEEDPWKESTDVQAG